MRINKLIKIFTAIIISTLIISGCSFPKLNKDRNIKQFDQSHSEDGSMNRGKTAGISCGNKKDFFDFAPLKADDYTGLLPLGNLSPAAHVFPTDHIYFFIKRLKGSPNPENNPTVKVPLYAPADAIVTEILLSDDLTIGKSDYSIFFSPCKDIRAYFIHVSSISKKLKAAIRGDEDCEEQTHGERTYKSCSYDTNIKINSGEKIGTAGGGHINALDLGVYDFRLNKLDFIKPQRQPQDRLYTACPIDYFKEPLKSKIMARFSDHEGSIKRTKEPVCGEIAFDKARTAQGVWFYGLKDNERSGAEDPHLALVPHNFETDKLAFSAGYSAKKSGLRAGQYLFKPESSGLVNRRFIDVKKDSKVYCYETVQSNNGPAQTIYIQLFGEETLRIEGRGKSLCGSGPFKLSSNYTDFKR